MIDDWKIVLCVGFIRDFIKINADEQWMKCVGYWIMRYFVDDNVNMRPFAIWDEDIFEMEENNTICKIKPLENADENYVFPHLIYPKQPNEGFQQGIHYFTAKFLDSWSDDSIIGVTSTFDPQLVHNDIMLRKNRPFPSMNDEDTRWVDDGTDDATESFYFAERQRRQVVNYNTQTQMIEDKDVTVTVQLDCNKHTVKYFRNKQLVRTDDIEPADSYYFALSVRAGNPDKEAERIVESVDSFAF